LSRFTGEVMPPAQARARGGEGALARPGGAEGGRAEAGPGGEVEGASAPSPTIAPTHVPTAHSTAMYDTFRGRRHRGRELLGSEAGEPRVREGLRGGAGAVTPRATARARGAGGRDTRGAEGGGSH